MATNKVYAQYQEVIDLQTVPDKVSVIGIHTPTGERPRKLLNGLFSQYRKFCYLGAEVRMQNAATLPIDPLGVSGIPGTTDTMDPRDSLNPIMTHGCHGDNLNQILDQIFQYEGDSNPSITKRDLGGVSGALLEQQYYRCLSDPTWKKWQVQGGIRLSLRPLVNKVVLTRELVPTEQYGVIAAQETRAGALRKTSAAYPELDGLQMVQDVVPVSGSSVPFAPEDFTYGDAQYNQMLTNGVTRLGWLSTRSFWKATSGEDLPYPADNMDSPKTYMPKAVMSCILLPPSYKQVQYFRMVITHRFAFAGFTAAMMNGFTYADAYTDLIDHGSKKPVYPEGSTDVQTYPINDTLETINADFDTVTDGVM